MYKFSSKSLAILLSCDERIGSICHTAIKIYDFSVICGYRDEGEQNKLYQCGKSKLQFPHSKHNCRPSQAIDIAPYPIDWNDEGRFKLLAGIMFGIAHSQNIKLRWGGDWNMNWDLTDQKFNDLGHFELQEV